MRKIYLLKVTYQYKIVYFLSVFLLCLYSKIILAYSHCFTPPSNQNDYKKINFTKAIENCDKLIQFEPINIIAYMDRAGLKLIIQDYIGAIQDYDQLIKLDPKNIELYLKSRAELKEKLEDYQGAIQDYNLMIEMNKTFPLYFHRALLKYGLKLYQEAIEDIDKGLMLLGSINSQPNVAGVAYSLRGICNYSLNNNNEALDNLNLSISLFNQSRDKPSNKVLSIAYHFRGLTQHDLKKNQEAIQDYNIAIKLDLNPKIYMDLARAKISLSDYRGAIQNIDQMLTLTIPKNKEDYQKINEAYLIRGIARYFIHDNQKSMEDLTTVINSNKEYITPEVEAITYFFIGRLQIDSGNLDNGCLYLSKSGEMGFTDAYEAIKIHCTQ